VKLVTINNTNTAGQCHVCEITVNAVLLSHSAASMMLLLLAKV